MVYAAIREQHPLFPQQGYDVGIGLENVHTCEVFHVVLEPPLGVDGREDGELVPDTREIVVLPVPRGRVDATRPGIRRHVVRQDRKRIPVDEGMTKPEPFHGTALETRYDLARESGILEEALQKRLGHDEGLVTAAHADVGEVGMEGDGEVGRERPRGGRPYDSAEVAAVEALGQPVVLSRRQRELYRDSRRRVVVVLDFGLGQRRLAMDAPLHGLHALVGVSLQEAVGEGPGDGRLISVIHGLVRMVPVAEYAQPFELGSSAGL